MNYLSEVETVLKQSQPKNDPAYHAFRSKTTKHVVLGHRLPLLHKIEENGFSFYNKSSKEILLIWDEIWKTAHFHETMYLPLFYYRHHKLTFGKSEWDVLKQWADQIENWEHSDTLSFLYSYFLERHPDMVLPTLLSWNQSSHPWKQRLSITSLIYYASKKRTAPSVDLVLSMVKPLIPSRDKYIGKAVGWTLRESYKLYPKETLTFIDNHLGDLSPDAFSYSTEKVDKETKEKLTNKRKILRSRSK